MLLTIPDLLSAEQVRHCRSQLDAADWIDGRATAGFQGSRVKHNRQLLEGSPAALALGDLIVAALERHPLFISAVLPLHVYPPLFNRYDGGQQFGEHIDNALRLMPGSRHKIRTDVSATLFLSEPDEYDGGELLIEDTYGMQSVKLPAGHLVVYPAASLHRVSAVTRGARLASFFWVQSMIRDDAQRTLLFDLDSAIQRLHQDHADARALLQLTGSYHNLLRMWSEL
ncbi:Fe2+-dependent dioxygenase [Undibacterium arcticum]|uniref:Fe2+-dependent dioxygenase n=1 Tax=Undibacterium arcticum TaxID=1762892 RepID=A0ABV7F198_9BURK